MLAEHLNVLAEHVEALAEDVKVVAEHLKVVAEDVKTVAERFKVVARCPKKRICGRRRYFWGLWMKYGDFRYTNLGGRR
jgi:hypothetical protein